MKGVLQSIISGATLPDKDKTVKQVQEHLFALSWPFQQEDIAALRQLKRAEDF